MKLITAIIKPFKLQEVKEALVDDGIEYMKDSNSKMKWDKWGNPYRVKMGKTQISLSHLNSSNIGVGNVHSTVTDLAKFLG